MSFRTINTEYTRTVPDHRKGVKRMRLSIAINTAMPVTMETPQRESLLVVMVTMQRTLRVLHCILRKVRWEGIGVDECLCVPRA